MNFIQIVTVKDNIYAKYTLQLKTFILEDSSLFQVFLD